VDDDAHQAEVRSAVASGGAHPTPVIDRFWFKSVYYKEPGGVLFELATDGPGFAVDEDPQHLGETLVLPPWLETKRGEIEAAVPRSRCLLRRRNERAYRARGDRYTSAPSECGRSSEHRAGHIRHLLDGHRLAVRQHAITRGRFHLIDLRHKFHPRWLREREPHLLDERNRSIASTFASAIALAERSASLTTRLSFGSALNGKLCGRSRRWSSVAGAEKVAGHASIIRDATFRRLFAMTR
jgi:hypothetical protein